MDMAGIIVQLGVLVGTLGAAAIAWWQANVASEAHRASDRAQKSAEAAAERAASAAERSAAAQERAATAGEQRARIIAESNSLAHARFMDERERQEREHRFQVASAVEEYSNVAIMTGFDSAEARAAWHNAAALARRFSVGMELVQWAIEAVPVGVANINADPNDHETYSAFVVNFGITARNYVDDPREFEIWRESRLAERRARGPKRRDTY